MGRTGPSKGLVHQSGRCRKMLNQGSSWEAMLQIRNSHENLWPRLLGFRRLFHCRRRSEWRFRADITQDFANRLAVFRRQMRELL
jgi:hypothetical protein